MKSRFLWSCVLVLFGINISLLVWLCLMPPTAAATQAGTRASGTRQTVAPSVQPTPPSNPETAAYAARLIANAQAALSQPPDEKKLAGMRVSVERHFDSLYRLLELNEAQYTQLSQLLLTRQQILDNALNTLFANGIVPAPAELKVAEDYATETIHAQIASLLGPDKAPDFLGYITRSTDYRIVDELDAKLSYTEQPLTAEARRGLVQALNHMASRESFLAEAGNILPAQQLEELNKSYDARDSRRLRLEIMARFQAANIPQP